MKILLIGRASPELEGKSVGGIATHMSDLASTLIDCKYDVMLFDYTLSKSYNKNGVSIRGVKWTERLKGVFKFARSLRKFRDILRFYTLKDLAKVSVQIESVHSLIEWADVVHIHSLHEPISGFLSEEQNKKMLITDHGFWQSPSAFREKGHNKLAHHISCCRKVLYVSDFALKKWRSHGLKIDAGEKLMKFPNPIKDNEKFNLSLPRDIIFFNGLSESMTRKRLPLFLEAVRSDQFRTFKIICVVDNAGKNFIRSKCSDMENLEAYGKLPFKEVQEIYQRSLVMALPSKSESFGLVYLEALINGCPIIGFEETFREFESVLKTNIGLPISPSDNSVELHSKLKRVLDVSYDPVMLNQRVTEHYGWNYRINELIQIYSEVSK